MPFWISIYTKFFCAKYCSLYCWIILSEIIFSGSFIYSYMSMGLFKKKLAMSEHMNFSFLVQINLLKMGLDVVRSTVGVVTSPGKLIRFPPTVSWVRCVSDIFYLISATIIPEVTVLSSGTFYLGINKFVLFPGGVIFPAPSAIRTILFAN